MPTFESTFLLLVVPAAAWAVGSASIASAYGDLKGRPPDPSNPVLPGRVRTFYAVAVTPAVFGFVLWFLLAGLEADFGPLSGPPAFLGFWASVTFGFASAVVAGVETWITHSRLKQYASVDFGRVLPIVVIPETAMIFCLILVFLTFGVIGSHLDGTEVLTEARAARIVFGLQVYAMSTLALPVAASLSNRVRDFSTTRDWVRALSLMEVGAGVTIAGLVWAFLQVVAT